MSFESSRDRGVPVEAGADEIESQVLDELQGLHSCEKRYRCRLIPERAFSVSRLEVSNVEFPSSKWIDARHRES